MQDEVASAAQVPGVVQVKNTRVRISGPEAFADLTLLVSQETTLDEAHTIADQAEAAVSQVLPGADVVVHVEPFERNEDGIASTVRILAAEYGLNAHGLRIYDIADERLLELHLEVDQNLNVDEAHAKASAFETAIADALPSISQVVSHIEPMGEFSQRHRGTAQDRSLVFQVLHEFENRLRDGLPFSSSRGPPSVRSTLRIITLLGRP